MIQLPESAVQDLKELNSSYRVIHRQGLITAQIIDTVTGRPYAKGTGPSEPDAVVAAIKVAKNSEKPKTVPQMLADQQAEIDRLRQQLKGLGHDPAREIAKPKPRRSRVSTRNDDVDAEPTEAEQAAAT